MVNSLWSLLKLSAIFLLWIVWTFGYLRFLNCNVHLRLRASSPHLYPSHIIWLTFSYACNDIFGSRKRVRNSLGASCPPPPHPNPPATIPQDTYRVFSHDVTAAILVSQNNETAAMLVSQTNPLGVELFSYANACFCSNKFAQMLATWVKTLYTVTFTLAWELPLQGRGWG